MRKKYPLRILLAIDDEIRENLRLIQAEFKTPTASETIRYAILQTARQLPKEALNGNPV